MKIEKKLTLLCIAVSSFIIIPSILFNKPIIALLGLIIDFLPTIFGWVRKAITTVSFPLAYTITVIFAYLIFLIWLFAPRVVAARVLFSEFWFLSVIARSE